MQHWALTDTGIVRPQNQDAYRAEQLDRNTFLCVVCDGMGGAKSGDVASTMAADAFMQAVKESRKNNMNQAELACIFQSALDFANLTVYNQALQTEEYAGMGTTLVALMIQGKQAILLNVGDSRGYLINEAGIEQITEDHSLVQMMISRGELTLEEARNHPDKNIITRAVGTQEYAKGDIFHREVKPGDQYLLCTDGLTNLMDDREILFEVAYEEDREQCCQRLVDLAKKRGAPDNVTCVLVSI